MVYFSAPNFLLMISIARRAAAAPRNRHHTCNPSGESNRTMAVLPPRPFIG